MKPRFKCPHYIKAGNRTIVQVEPTNEGWLEARCDAGHQFETLIRYHEFQILFEIGINAIHDGCHRKAIGSFAASYQRFIEFFVRIVVMSAEEDVKKNRQGVETYAQPVGAASRRLYFHPSHDLQGVAHAAACPAGRQRLSGATRRLPFRPPIRIGREHCQVNRPNALCIKEAHLRVWNHSPSGLPVHPLIRASAHQGFRAWGLTPRQGMRPFQAPRSFIANHD